RHRVDKLTTPQKNPLHENETGTHKFALVRKIDPNMGSSRHAPRSENDIHSFPLYFRTTSPFRSLRNYLGRSSTTTAIKSDQDIDRPMRETAIAVSAETSFYVHSDSVAYSEYFASTEYVF
ncbi:hypothetical protein WA026_008166, partial [Henosepilachna vigintioctopunctata]